MGTGEADGPDKTSTAGAENRRGRLSVLYPDKKAHARKNRRRV
jgi:hypothetical protein